MNDQQIRAEQLEAGRRQGGTLRASSIVRKPKVAGHEAFLKALEVSNAIVTFVMISSGREVNGTVKHSDKFTVSVVEKFTDQVRVLFKHDISEFWTTGVKQQSAVAA